MWRTTTFILLEDCSCVLLLFRNSSSILALKPQIKQKQDKAQKIDTNSNKYDEWQCKIATSTSAKQNGERH